MTIAINLPESLQKQVLKKMASSHFVNEEELILSALSYYMAHENEEENQWGEESEFDNEWKAELNHRLEEIENGTAKLIDGDEVFAEIDKLIAEVRHA